MSERTVPRKVLQPADDAPDAVCPNCGAPLVDHKATEGPKAGAWHCDVCGGCWVKDGKSWRIRDGHPAPSGWGG